MRWVMLAFIVGAILVGLSVQAACVSAFAQFAVPDNRMLGLVSKSTAIALASGGLSFLVAIKNAKWLKFSDEVVGELIRVTWPSREETVRASTTVVLTTLFTAAVLAGYDVIWKNLADLILFTEG
jgi:preprotein translocase subunit SecE